MSEATEMGPIDFLVVEFSGSRMTGDGLRALVNLTDRGIIRVLDLVFVRKDLDHSLIVLEITDLYGDGTFDLTIFEGVSSGLIGSDEIDAAGAVLRPGNSAAILIYGNRWAAPLAEALRRGGAQLVASGRIPFTDTATAVSNRVSGHQAGRWARQEPAEHTVFPDDDIAMKLAQLRELSELKGRGVLSQEEFDQQKRWILQADYV